jgi:hypothetical protein
MLGGRTAAVRVAAATALAVGAAWSGAGMAAPAQRGAVVLGPLLRVQTPPSAADACPYESEPEIASTSAGTWVAYNNDPGCVHVALGLTRPTRFTRVQLLPVGGAPRRVVELPPDVRLLGDPDLAPDPDGRGGVLLSTLVRDEQVTGTRVAVVRIPSRGPASLLPSPSLSNGEDKEFLATDSGRHSRYRGRSYLVWDDFATFQVTFRAFDGRRWLPPVTLGTSPGGADVAVAPNGDVAVTWSTPEGVSVAVSRDGGGTFGPARSVLTGEPPGRNGQTCYSMAVVGERQRARMSARVAWDRLGRLHVVAALRVRDLALSADLGLRGGDGQILHAKSTDGGRSFGPVTAVAADAPDASAVREVQWAPAVAALPDGGIAVSYLQIAPSASYEAFVAIKRAGASTFSRPLALSAAPAEQPRASEAYGYALCYGLGDYTGLAATPSGVVATWPTTLGVERPGFDSDIAVRAVQLVR